MRFPALACTAPPTRPPSPPPALSAGRRRRIQGSNASPPTARLERGCGFLLPRVPLVLDPAISRRSLMAKRQTKASVAVLHHESKVRPLFPDTPWDPIHE